MKRDTSTDILTLDAHPSDAPCCVKLESEDGKSVLLQTDWDWPAVAGLFGFPLRSVQKCDCCGKISSSLHNTVVKYCRHCETNVGHVCEHSGTDGTVDCACGVMAGDFISAAREWIDEHDGETCENPGYNLE